MPNFHELAAQLSAAFERKTRDNGDSYVCLKNSFPWMTNLIHAAHGDMLPDDWRYRFIQAAANHFAEADSDLDEYYDGCDATVSIYTHDLTAWLHSSLTRVAYVDDTAEEYGIAKDGGIVAMLSAGQHAEIIEVFGIVAETLRKLAEEE